MIKRFLGGFSPFSTHEIHYGHEIARLIAIWLVAVGLYFLGRSLFDTFPRAFVAAALMAAPIMIYPTHNSIGRLFQIHQNRTDAIMITPVQLAFIREKCPDKTVYLFVENKYVALKKKTEYSPSADVLLIRIGEDPLEDIDDLADLLNLKSTTQDPPFVIHPKRDRPFDSVFGNGHAPKRKRVPNDDPAGLLSVADALKTAHGKRRLSVRCQGKTYWRLARFLGKGSFGYRRARALIFFGAAPESPAERAFQEGWLSYWSAVCRGKAAAFDPDEPLVSFLERTLPPSGIPDDLLAFGRTNGILLASGLWPVYLRNGDGEEAHLALSGSAEALARLLLRTPLEDESYLSSLRALSKDEAEAWLMGLPGSEPFVARAFLMGSFLHGDLLWDSDVDVGVAFEKGLTEREKLAVLERIASAGLSALGRRIDAKEVLLDESGRPLEEADNW